MVKLLRIRPRFTLWALLVLITLIAIPLSYVAQRRAWNVKRKEAFAHLVAKQYGVAHSIPKVPTNLVLQLWQQLVAEIEMPQVTEITTSAFYQPNLMNNDDLRFTRYFPEIERIEIYKTSLIDDDGLGVLANFPKLRDIVLVGMPNVSGEFLENVCRSTAPMRIHLHNLDRLEGKHLRHLHGLPSLISLSFEGCPLLNDTSLMDVELPASVVYLVLERCPVGDATIVRWLANRQIHRLNLQAKVTRNAAVALKDQHELEQIAIKNAPFIDEDFRFLENCRELVNLSIEAAPVRGELLSWMPQPSRVEHLRCDSTLFEDRYLATLSQFPKLASIELNWTPISGEGWKSVMTLPDRCRIELVGTRFSDQGKSALAAIRSGGQGNLGKITLPSNWTCADFALFPDRNPPWPISLPASAQNDVNLATGQEYEITRMPQFIDSAEPLDNCPVDLMAPVIRLQELAKECAKEVK